MQLFNDKCEVDRANRRREMICLYKKITKSCILGLLAYRDYVIEGTLMLDTQKYRNDFREMTQWTIFVHCKTELWQI